MTKARKIKFARKELLRLSEHNICLDQALQRSQRSARQSAELIIKTRGLLKDDSDAKGGVKFNVRIDCDCGYDR